jgi:enoyl reductase-like protein
MDTSSQQQIDDKIADSLGLEPLNNNQKQLPVSIEHTVEADFDYARGNIIVAIEKGQEALSDMLQVAQRSQSPRAFEVVSDLVKTLSQTNKDLLELMKQKKIIENSDGPKTVNNNLFVGSTTELLKLMKKQDE